MPISRTASKTLVILVPLILIILAAIFVVENFSDKLTIRRPGKSKIIDIKPNATSSDEKRFNEIMIDFYSMSDMARGIFPIDTALAARDKSMSDLKDIGLYYWKRNLEILDSAKKFNNSREISRKITAYEDFCKLHIGCYELMYKAIDKHTNAYDKEIAKQLALIDAKTNEIKGY